MSDGIKLNGCIRTKDRKRGRVVGIWKNHIQFDEVIGQYPVSVQYTGSTFTVPRHFCKVICKPKRVYRLV